MCFENLVARLPGKNLLHSDAEAGRERRRNYEWDIFKNPRPRDVLQGCCSKDRVLGRTKCRLGMVRHLICGDGDGRSASQQVSLFRSGLDGVCRPIAAFSADHPLDRCNGWGMIRCHRGTCRCARLMNAQRTSLIVLWRDTNITNTTIERL
jgi:hypothetical protein